VAVSGRKVIAIATVNTIAGILFFILSPFLQNHANCANSTIICAYM
jgi:hypothetical protein